MLKTAFSGRFPRGSNRHLAKTFLIMRLTIFLLTAAFLDVSATGLSQQITYSGKNIHLKKVFAEIKRQTGYSVIYTDNTLRDTKPVTLKMENVPLTEFLDVLLKDQPVISIIESKTIIIYKKTASPVSVADILGDELSLSQPPVTGVIRSADGLALSGATIRIKGKNKITVSDNNGSFEINADAGSILIVSYIGFEEREFKLTDRSPVTIILQQFSRNMDTAEVIVSTGYQQISKERSAGSYAKPDMKIIAARSTSMNILQRLDGLVPGLTINNAPSASQNPLLIRGLSTIGISDGQGGYSGTSRSPLYVVDGIALDDVASINPQDVADITVLKDATAASIWGSRASNGVIVITSKKGTPNEKISVQYDGFSNFKGKPDLNYKPVLNSRQFIQVARETFDPEQYPWSVISEFTNLGSTGVAPHNVILYGQYRGLISEEQANKSLDSLASINNVSQIRDLWYRNAMLMNHTISLSGGSKKYAFYGSLAYTDNQSNRPGEKDNTYKVNLRQDFTFNKHIQAYLLTDLTNTVTAAKRTVNVDNTFYPYQLFQDAGGNNLSMSYMSSLNDSIRQVFENQSGISLDYNPLNEFNHGYTKSNALMNRLVAGVTVKFFPGLSFQGVYGYIRGTNRTTSFDDHESYTVRSKTAQFTNLDVSGNPVYNLPNYGGSYAVTNTSQRNWTLRNQLVYDNAWNGGLHQLTLLTGQEAQERLSVVNNSTVWGYDESLQTYALIDYSLLSSTGVSSAVWPNYAGNGSLLFDRPFSETESQVRYTSYYANAAYTFNRKYTANGSWRIDKSNLFGIDKGAQNRPVWSVGVRWLLSEENFVGHIPWLDRLALRATYGVTGNSPAPGTAASYDILTPLSGSFIPNGAGLAVETPSNRKLTWESTETINIGVDFSVFQNRVSGSVDFYSKKTEDLLGDLSVNSFSGYASITGNFGNLQNKGIELSLNSRNISTKAFSWSSLLTLAYNKNKITQLNSAGPVTTGAQKAGMAYLTGYPAFAIFAYRFAGLDTMGDPMIGLTDKTITKERNTATPDDIEFMGTYQPVWNGGLSNFFQYKGFGLNVNIVYNLGHVMRRDINQFYSGRIYHSNFSNNGLQGANIHADFVNRWKKKGDEAITNIPSYVANSADADTRRDIAYYAGGDVNVLSASYIKLKDITLSYSLPAHIANSIKTKDITFRVQLSNLMLWKANKYGIDPEFQDASNGLRTMPFDQRTITVGLHATL
jgi:TonB-linked SusC/RagA family outer membrane protein